MQKRKIVFTNQATGYLTIDILNEFANEFDEVALITGSIRIQNTGLESNVRISLITKYNRGSNFKKAFSWLLGTVQTYFLLLFKYRDYERILFTVPPPVYLMAPLLRSKYSIVVYDLYPDALSTLGMSDRNIFFRWWAHRNKKVFLKAENIFTISELMRTGIRRYCPESNVHVIPNWSAFSGMKRMKRSENDLIVRNNFTGKFIVQYSGNIGLSHKIETLIEVADSLRSYDDILFLIIGRGKRVEDIKMLIHHKELKNCIILPFRNDDELFDSLCAADIAVVTLDDKVPDISVPSKVYNILASGSPLLAIASPDSGLGDLIKRYNNGGVFCQDDIKGIANFILDIKSDPELYLVLSSCSLEASKNYTSANAGRYLELYN